MFEFTNTSYLHDFDILLELSRAKNCRKLSFRRKLKNIEPACLEQNTIRTILKKALPIETNHIEDNHFGVDYEYKGITIDQKFSFGELGEDTIKIRVINRQLLNNSDWTMAINKNWGIELFQTNKLAQFVRRNWGIVQKRLVEKNRNYNAYAVKLSDLYKIEHVEPKLAQINKETITPLLEDALMETNSTIIQETIFENQSILDKNKHLCFEPNLAILAKQILKQTN